MTTITLMTNDQALSVVMKPLVASGDYNLVKVQVEFDNAWERYPVRSAVFRTTNGSEAEVLLTDGGCTIPHEVLAEPGTLFIAIRGATLSGNIIKTTEEVKYKIVQGAKDIASTTAPSDNMFAQYMAAIAAGIAPHIDAMEAEASEKVDRKIAELDAIDGLYVKIKVDKYTGDGKYGETSPNSITCDFVPKYVVVISKKNGFSEHETLHLVSGCESISCSINSFTLPLYINWNGNTVSWYMHADGNAAAQFNTDKTTYYYVALGV